MKTLSSVLLAGILFAAVLGPVPVQADEFDCSGDIDIPQIECEALVALYNSTNGDFWFDNTNWLSTNTLDGWYGIYVESGHVKRIVIYVNNLSGSIPPELGNLSSLMGLELAGNNLSGAIPPELGNLSSLQGLDLNENNLSGLIPPELGNLSSLQVLSFYSNPLSGAIPLSFINLPLQIFVFGQTYLCEPSDPVYVSWTYTVGIYLGTGVICKYCYLPAVIR